MDQLQIENDGKRLYRTLHERIDALYKEAIARHLGKQTWTYKDIVGRCRMNRDPHGWTTLLIDEVPIFTIETTPRLETLADGDGHSIVRALQSYLFLIPPPTDAAVTQDKNWDALHRIGH